MPSISLYLIFSGTMATVTKRLAGKVALITGAAGGLGECTAKLFAKHGAKVIVADIQDQLGHGVCEAIGSSNSKFVHCDVSKEEDVKNAVDVAVATYGKLDIVFNNAAILDPYKSNVVDTEKSDFEHLLSINLTGVFLGMKHAARVMVPRQSGSIISTSSIASQLSGMSSHAYSASKYAVVGLTKNMAVELGQYGIRVNCVSPSGMFTPMVKHNINVTQEDFEKTFESTGILKGVTLKAADVADSALFLVSDDAKYITGQNLVVDGGYTIASPINMFTRSSEKS